MRSVKLSPKPLPPYVYACIDRSILVQPFCRVVVARFARVVPAEIPANFLTLGSSLCVGLMLVAAVHLHPGGAAAPWCAALMFGYIIYDHADGMHARRTGTSGPLGEYLDHYLDAFNGPIAVVTMFLVAGQQARDSLLLLVGAITVASASTMLEQKETRTLYFGLIGPLEGMRLTLGYLLSWCLPHAASFWFGPTPWPGTWFSTLAWAGLAGSGLTTVASLWRIGRVPASFCVYLVSTGAMLWAIPHLGLAWSWSVLIVSLHGSDYTGRLLGSHLRGTARPWPDLLAPLAVGVAWAVPGHAPVLAWAVGAYLAGRNLQATISNLSAFRQFWRWRNLASAVIREPRA